MDVSQTFKPHGPDGAVAREASGPVMPAMPRAKARRCRSRRSRTCRSSRATAQAHAPQAPISRGLATGADPPDAVAGCHPPPTPVPRAPMPALLRRCRRRRRCSSRARCPSAGRRAPRAASYGSQPGIPLPMQTEPVVRRGGVTVLKVVLAVLFVAVVAAVVAALLLKMDQRRDPLGGRSPGSRW